LTLRSYVRLLGIDPGFDPSHVLTLGIDLDLSHYHQRQDIIQFQDQLLRQVRIQPGVVAAAFASTFPLNQGGPPTLDLVVRGQPRHGLKLSWQVDYRAVSAAYFETLRMPLLEGRDFAANDSAASLPVIIVSRSTAWHLWPGESPLGALVSLDGGEAWRTVVGVVGDARQYGLDRAAAEEVYVPAAQQPFLNGNLLVRTVGPPMHLTPIIRKIMRGIDPRQPIAHVATMENLKYNSLASPRLTLMLLLIFASVALAVTATGLAGLLVFFVRERTHEIGIRIALGARRTNVLWFVLRQVVMLFLLALPLGLGGALAFNRFATSLFFEISPADSPTYVVVSLFLLAVAGLSCLSPLRRAMVIQPMVALKNE